MLEKVFISGCDRGVGRALAALFAARGWEVAAGCHSPDGLDACARMGASVHPIPLEIASAESVAAAASETERRLGALGLLVNNAAVLGVIDDPIDGPLDFDSMLRTFDVNALGPLRLTKALLPLLAAGGSPRVVNVSSEAGSSGACRRDSWYGYCMSKAALNRQSVLLHHDLRKRGGGVLVLHPGWVRSWMQGQLDEKADLSPEEAAERAWGNIFRPGVFDGPQPRYLDHEGKELPW